MTHFPFHDSIQWTPTADRQFSGAIHPSWFQGRGAFGGLLGAICIHQWQKIIPKNAQPRSVQFNFAFPVDAQEWTLSFNDIRTIGRTHFQSATLYNHVNKQAFAATCIHSSLHDDIANYQHIQMPDVPSVEDTEIISNPMMPTFTQYFEMRAAPAATHDSSIRFGGWIRLKDSTALTPALAFAYLDAWPPAAFLQCKKSFQGGTVLAQVFFCDALYRTRFADDAFFYVDTQTQHADSGWVEEVERLFSADGQLLAFSNQHIALYTARV
jgi:acyl-CoA thioesterase